MVKVGGFTLHEVSLEVEKGDYFVVLGVSGAGKSLLLETVAGIVSSSGGRIFLDGEDITNQKIQHRRAGLVYQDHALFPHMTVSENIAYPLKNRKVPKAKIVSRTRQLTEGLNISNLASRKPSTLSGGERQRVALARTLALDPAILLLDEPLSSLDVQLKADLRRLLRKINQEGMTIMHVTHDYEEAISLANKVAVLHEGRIIQSGTIEDVFHHPKSAFIANFTGIKNFFRATVTQQHEDDGETSTRAHVSDRIIFSLHGQIEPCEGFVMIRGEDILISNSRPDSSATNNFEGVVTEIIPGPKGMEITVDTGVCFTAIITPNSLIHLDLKEGNKVWISFKATAVRFIEG
jgi:molybdopterin-binding protein